MLFKKALIMSTCLQPLQINVCRWRHPSASDMRPTSVTSLHQDTFNTFKLRQPSLQPPLKRSPWQQLQTHLLVAMDVRVIN